MKYKFIVIKIVFLFLVLLVAIDQVQATAISLNYSISNIGGGLYNYEFNLLLDNHDGTWQPGQGWRWLIFGDALLQPSPLINFIGDPTDFPVGPWTYYSTTSGYHNGISLGNVTNFWIPTYVGDSINWSGTSMAFLGEGELRYSTIAGTLNSAVPAFFEAANYTTMPSAVPEPGTIFLLGIGVASFGLFRRIRNK